MFPVYLNTNRRGVNFQEFVDNFLEICKSHQQHKRASAFAFIIYDFHKPHLRKVLMDTDYWDTLNKVSGHYLTIFSLFEDPTKHKLNDNLFPRKVRMSFEAVKVNTQKDLVLSYKQIVELFFGGTEFPSPSVLFFQVSEDKISDHFFVSLKEDKIEEGFNELKNIIDESIAPIKEITPENKNNYDEIFRLIEINVNSAIWWKKAKKVATKSVNLLSFLSIFK